MRTSKWIVTATLLASFSAVAQQPSARTAAAQPASSAHSVANAQPQAPRRRCPRLPPWTRWSTASSSANRV